MNFSLSYSNTFGVTHILLSLQEGLIKHWVKKICTSKGPQGGMYWERKKNHELNVMEYSCTHEKCSESKVSVQTFTYFHILDNPHNFSTFDTGGVEVQARSVAPRPGAPLGLGDRVLHLRKVWGTVCHLTPPQQPQLLQTQQQRVLLFALRPNLQDQNSPTQVRTSFVCYFF